MEAFYLPDGDSLVPTVATRGPWSNDHQHGGPPSALLVRAAEAATPGMAVARITVELLRPVPMTPLRVAVTVDKAGRKATTLSVVLTADDRPCLTARVLCIRAADVGVPPVVHAAAAPHPDDCAPFQFTFFRAPEGYHTAVETRLARGVWGQGDMALWMRPRVPLVAGETTSPAQRVLICADAGSGVTAALDPRRVSFLNADLTVALLRSPTSAWTLMDGITTVGSEGRALASCRLADPDGTFGHSAQSLVVEPLGD